MSSSPNPPIPPANRSSGAGGVLVWLLALVCIGLGIASIALYSGKASAEKAAAAAKQEATEAQSLAKKATDDLSASKGELNRVLTDRNMRYVMIAQLPQDLQGANPVETLDKIKNAHGGAPVAGAGTPGSNQPNAAPGAVRPAAPADSPQAALENVARVVIKSSINTNLDPGTDPAKVQVHRQVQTVLARVGAFSKPVSGNFKDTADAVKAFQKANGLKVDGIIGKGTWGKVREKFEATAKAN